MHGMSVDPDTNRVLLATHDGLFDVSESPAIQIGPTIDLMGFTPAGNGELYASGHPGPGTDLPNPVGLIRSTDQGQTWQPLSRQGESDFHALAATDGGIVGFDGQLRISADGTSWEAADEQIPAFNLAATSRDSVVLATTEEGLQRSTDDGETWAAVPSAPLLMLTALSGGEAAGVTVEGQIHTSSDAGLTWVPQGAVRGEASAIATHVLDDSTLRIWVATEDGVQVSNDNGQTFGDIRSNHQQ
ncbi:F510_1955 family glycosylhydrolase [Arthrobacter sp. HLT1-21]